MSKRIAALILFPAMQLAGQGLTGMWEAELDLDGRAVPFRMEFEGSGAKLRAAVLDGERRLWSSAASLEENRLSVQWDFYDARLEANLASGSLRGMYRRQGRGGKVERGFSAKPWKSPAEETAAAPSIAGAWRMEVDSQSRSRVMKGMFRQSGRQVSGTIQRIDGDFGTLEGRWRGDTLRLSHFDLIRATLVEIRQVGPGKLVGTLDGKQQFTAVPLGQAEAAGLTAPPDPGRYTSVKNPAEPFQFAFNDLDGKRVSLTDARFAGKAVIVSLTGSWCPNCHDEAPFLKSLYEQWKTKGLEVISVFFEYTGEPVRDREQIRIFMRRHGMNWTVLYAGLIEDGAVEKAFPQLAGFGAFPTTIFLGRDHRVASVHAGFAGPANLEEHVPQKRELSELTRRLVENR